MYCRIIDMKHYPTDRSSAKTIGPVKIINYFIFIKKLNCLECSETQNKHIKYFSILRGVGLTLRKLQVLFLFSALFIVMCSIFDEIG